MYHLFHQLYLKTHFFSVQTRIIVTLLIFMHLLTDSTLSLYTLELFYPSLVYTLFGQIYIDIKMFLLKKPFDFGNVYGYIMKVLLSYYCTFSLNLAISYSAILVSVCFMLLYKLSYEVYDIYQITFIESVLTILGTFFMLYLHRGELKP